MPALLLGIRFFNSVSRLGQGSLCSDSRRLISVGSAAARLADTALDPRHNEQSLFIFLRTLWLAVLRLLPLALLDGCWGEDSGGEEGRGLTLSWFQFIFRSFFLFLWIT